MTEVVAIRSLFSQEDEDPSEGFQWPDDIVMHEVQHNGVPVARIVVPYGYALVGHRDGSVTCESIVFEHP